MFKLHFYHINFWSITHVFQEQCWCIWMPTLYPDPYLVYLLACTCICWQVLIATLDQHLNRHSIDISITTWSTLNWHLSWQSVERQLIFPGTPLSVDQYMYIWVSWHSANYWLHVEISDEWPLRYWSSAKSIDLHSTADAFGLVHMIPWPYGARALKHHLWLKNGSLL